MKRIIPVAVSVCILCTSCYHVYYSPNTANTPLLTEKNEARINGAVALGSVSELTGGEIQFAYAITNHFGFMVNGFAGGKAENTGEYVEKGNGQYIEMAPGFFIPLTNDKKWIAEIYGGFGTGSVNNDYGLGNHSKVGITKLFLQPAFGYKTKNFEIALAPKISFVNWKVKVDQISYTDTDKEMIERIKANPKFTAFEPAIIFRGGGETVKVQVGYSFSKLSATLMDMSETDILSVGVSINIKNRKK